MTDQGVEKPETLLEFLQRNKSLITDGKPGPHFDADQLILDAARACMASARLQQCSRRSIATAVMRAYRIQVSLDDMMGMANLIPRSPKRGERPECKLELEYKGQIELIYRSDRVILVSCNVVYEADPWDYDLGTGRFVKHHYADVPENERGKIIAAYCIIDVEAKTGKHVAQLIEVVLGEELEATRAKADRSSPWHTPRFYPAMCRKTPVHRIAKYAPKNPWLSVAVEMQGLDEAGKLGAIDPAFEGEEDPNPTTDTSELEKALADGSLKKGSDLPEKPEQQATSPETDRKDLVERVWAACEQHSGYNAVVREALMDDGGNVTKEALAKSDLTALQDVAREIPADRKGVAGG